MAGNCQIDFYLLGSASPGPRELACKLAMMAWERGHSIAIVTESEADAAALDELMWNYPEQRFLPHECCDGDSDSAAPVRITDRAPKHQGDVVINLTSHALPDPGLFSRLLEIVPHQQSERQASRQKFSSYRALGIEPSTHEIN